MKLQKKIVRSRDVVSTEFFFHLEGIFCSLCALASASQETKLNPSEKPRGSESRMFFSHHFRVHLFFTALGYFVKKLSTTCINEGAIFIFNLSFYGLFSLGRIKSVSLDDKKIECKGGLALFNSSKISVVT